MMSCRGMKSMIEPENTQAPEDSATPTILCVDDEPNILSALRRAIVSFGYRVVTANSGPDGLQLLQKDPAEIVISDMRMPGMDGVSFLEYVSVRWPDTTRILLTGYSSLEATVDAINRGRVFSYIAKPWDDEDLQITIRQAFHHHEAMAENRRLANQVREQQLQLDDKDREIERLRRMNPELMDVERDAAGAISIEGDEDDDKQEH